MPETVVPHKIFSLRAFSGSWSSQEEEDVWFAENACVVSFVLSLKQGTCDSAHPMINKKNNQQSLEGNLKAYSLLVVLANLLILPFHL